MARYACQAWCEPDSGIWELKRHRQFVDSKVMCWVVLDRAVRIARQVGGCDEQDVARWEATAREVRAAVLSRGYAEASGAFRQRYDVDSLDCASLLIPVMGFLLADDRRVLCTLDRLDDVLGFEGPLYRFVPQESEGEKPLPVGQFEGAFLPVEQTRRARAGATARAVGARVVQDGRGSR